MIVVLGPGFSHQKSLQSLLAGAHRTFDIREKIDDLSCLIAEVDLAVASFGVTAYELAAMGVPSIYVCLTKDHAESASALVKANMGISLGMLADVTEKVLAEAVGNLLRDETGRIKMAQYGPEHVDGQGTSRIAQIVAVRIKNRNG